MPDIFVAEPENKNEPPSKKHESLEIAPHKSVKSSPIVDDLSRVDNNVHLFTSFSQNPKGISFKTQEQEEIIYQKRRKF